MIIFVTEIETDMAKKNENGLMLEAFPEEIPEEGSKIYDETSYEN